MENWYIYIYIIKTEYEYKIFNHFKIITKVNEQYKIKDNEKFYDV